jgi:diguanylate cyclase (GGDEF)-like protein
MLRDSILTNGQTTQSERSLEERLAHAVSIQEKVDLTNMLAWSLRIREPARALTLCSESLELSRTCGGHGAAYEPGIAASQVTMSFLDGEMGRLDTSLSLALEALSHIQEQPLPEILIGAWYTLGWAYFYSGDYPAALEFGLKSLKLAREIENPERIAWCLDLVASTYKEPLQVIEMYREAFDIFEKLDIIEGQSRILNNWAFTLKESKEYEQALELAYKSLTLATQGHLQGDVINVSATIGEILTEMGKYSEAQSRLSDATLLFDEYGRDISSVYILVDLGQVHLEQNNLDQAEQVLNSALEVSEKMEMRNEQARCHLYLSQIFERRVNFEKALEHYKKFQSLRESISGEGALKQLAALRVSHQIETAQRDAEIHRLQKEKLQIELDEHKRIHAILEDLATRDPLTNLFNRRHFLTLAEQEWKRAMRYKRPLSALMMDVDHFKQINDQHGHASGDKALTTVANVIRSTLRATEIAGRYGGDEFVVLLPETSPENGLLVAKRICQTITDYTISSDVGVIELTSSIGVASFTKENHMVTRSLSELLSHADKALYHAKKAGRGQAQLYSIHG